MYQHILDNQISALPVGKVVCIGRNYLDHVRELGNQPSEEAVLFIKPQAAMVKFGHEVAIPTKWGECHNELEVALLIGETLNAQSSAQQCLDAIVGVGLALDLTLRDVQVRMRDAGHPWERAKAFDASCPLSEFIPTAEFTDLDALAFNLLVDGQLRQQGNTANMMRSMLDIITSMKDVFTLSPGDVVITGTPAGVAALHPGQALVATLADKLELHSRVVARD